MEVVEVVNSVEVVEMVEVGGKNEREVELK